jgi:hypothetical protein
MIRLFVGCAANHEDLESQAVLEWSVRKHASEPVEITWMRLSRDPASPWSGWATERWATPFSGFRWCLPEVCGFQGRAIYCDSDVIFMADVAELWRQEFKPGKAIMAKGGGSWRLCVSLWDCEAMRKHLPPLAAMKANSDFHRAQCGRISAASYIQAFDGNWNCLDGEKCQSLHDRAIKAIHYTSIGTQPQLSYALPRLRAMGRRHWYDGKVEKHWRSDLVALFGEMLEEAKVNGCPPERYADEPVYGDFRKASLKNYHSGPRAA